MARKKHIKLPAKAKQILAESVLVHCVCSKCNYKWDMNTLTHPTLREVGCPECSSIYFHITNPNEVFIETLENV